MTIQTLDGTYTLTPDEEWRVRIGLGIALGLACLLLWWAVGTTDLH